MRRKRMKCVFINWTLFICRPCHMRILIIEDELRLARHIASALIEAGHNPTIVQDGETRIGEAQGTLYDLIILRDMLPGRDGFEVLRRLRADGIASRVIMLTARAKSMTA